MKTQTPEQRVQELEARTKELERLLRLAPPKHTINDQRFWSWHNLVNKALEKSDAAK